MSIPYNVTITHPATLWEALQWPTGYQHYGRYFITARYAELENPIMYSKPDYTTFTVDGMEILISVYSPSEKLLPQA
jgi:hypothetical protein